MITDALILANVDLKKAVKSRRAETTTSHLPTVGSSRLTGQIITSKQGPIQACAGHILSQAILLLYWDIKNLSGMW